LSTSSPEWGPLRRLADLLDSRFRIPGTRQTFGVDAILGVVPVVGDLAGLLASAVVVARAIGLGARGWTLASMLVNVAVDATVGSVPVAGTVFDVVWKANTRNVRLLEAHLEDPAAARRAARHGTLRSLLLLALVTLAVSTALVVGVVLLLRAVF
jgi:hypothetical protein